MAHLNDRSGGQESDIVLQDFGGGVNLLAAREAINENEFYWLENIFPFAPGNLSPVAGPGVAIQTVSAETGAPSYTQNFNVAGVDYVFAVWSATGNGYVMRPVIGQPVTRIGSGLWTSGQTAATQWNNQGLLIVDPTGPTGYWDWNVTTPNTLTGYAQTGSSIAAYAGRAWIAKNRTVTFTDANSYSSFAGSGSSFVINDDYLHSGINRLFNSFGYLYIGGDDSWDVLSNVQVSGGVASFTRTNVTTSIGTNQPNSVSTYLRSLAFANSSGFWLLSGASPQMLSEPILGFIKQVIFSSAVWAGVVVIQTELALAFLCNFTDIFSSATANTARTILAIFVRGRWWFISQPGLNVTSIVSIPTNSNQTLYGWSGNSLYQLMASTSNAAWTVRTRLWAEGSPLTEKQAINAAVAANFLGSGAPGMTIYIDTELGSTQTTIGGQFGFIVWVNNANNVVAWVNNAAQTVQWLRSPIGYQLLVGYCNAGGTQYLGMTVTGGANQSQVRLMAIRAKEGRNMLR